MNTPLTSGISVLLYNPEESLNYHEYYPGQLDSDNSNVNTNCRLQKFSFDGHSSNSNHFFSEDDYNFLRNFVPDQSTLQNPYGVPTSVNSFLGDSDDIPYNDFLTSSMFQAPSNTTPAPSQNLDGARNPVLHSIHTEYKNPVAAHFNFAHYDSSPNENWSNRQHSFVFNDSSKYISSESPPSQQQQHYYDAYGNVISPLRALNEQYDLQLNQKGMIGAGLDPSFLVRAPPLADNVQHHCTQPSGLLTTRPQQNFVPPPPQSLTPAQNPCDPPVKVKRRRRRKPPPPPEVAAAKHKAFLQRNREAASKCRTKKKTQINDLEDEERVGRQTNAVLKDEFKDILGEVLSLQEQVKEMPCDEQCEGCGDHAPMRRNRVVATSSIGTNSVRNSHKAQSDEEDEVDDEEDNASGSASLRSPLSVDSRYENVPFNSEVVNGETQVENNSQTWNKRKRDEPDTITH